MNSIFNKKRTSLNYKRTVNTFLYFYLISNILPSSDKNELQMSWTPESIFSETLEDKEEFLSIFQEVKEKITNLEKTSRNNNIESIVEFIPVVEDIFSSIEDLMKLIYVDIKYYNAVIKFSSDFEKVSDYLELEDGIFQKSLPFIFKTFEKRAENTKHLNKREIVMKEKENEIKIETPLSFNLFATLQYIVDFEFVFFKYYNRNKDSEAEVDKQLVKFEKIGKLKEIIRKSLKVGAPRQLQVFDIIEKINKFYVQHPELEINEKLSKAKKDFHEINKNKRWIIHHFSSPELSDEELEEYEIIIKELLNIHGIDIQEIDYQNFWLNKKKVTVCKVEDWSNMLAKLKIVADDFKDVDENEWGKLYKQIKNVWYEIDFRKSKYSVEEEKIKLPEGLVMNIENSNKEAKKIILETSISIMKKFLKVVVKKYNNDNKDEDNISINDEKSEEVSKLKIGGGPNILGKKKRDERRND